jgi:hypothetical protein
MAKDIRMQEARLLLWQVRDEAVQLLFNRYIFRTLQEIVRANQRLQGRQRGKFCDWSRVVYAVANTIAVRRLASDKYGPDDASLTRFIDLAKRHPDLIWKNILRFYPDDAAGALQAARDSGKSGSAADLNACRRLFQEDRRLLVHTAEPVVEFASKRVAHHNPTTIPRSTFLPLDKAIDVIITLTEKYKLLIYRSRFDLLAIMRQRRLPDGWDQIFLEPWATPELLDHDPPLGEMAPPLRPTPTRR